MTDYYIEPIGSGANWAITQFLEQRMDECQALDTICTDGIARKMYKVDKQTMIHALAEPDLSARFFKGDDGVAPFGEEDFGAFISDVAFASSGPRQAILQHMRNAKRLDNLSNAELEHVRQRADGILAARKMRADIGAAAGRKPMQRAGRKQHELATK